MTKKHIKTSLKFLLVGIILSSLMGCTKDKEEDFSLPRDRYLGNWIGQTATGAGYHVTISSDPSHSTQVLIYNFFSLGNSGFVTATVTEGTITVPNQKMQGIPGNYWCKGIGNLSKRNGIYTIYWSSYTDGEEETTSTYTKQ